MKRRELSLYPFDYLVIGYCLAMIILIGIFGRPLEQYADEVTFYASMMLVALVIIRFADETQSGIQRFFRLLYPALMFTFFYRETGGSMFLLFNKFLDPQLTGFENRILGGDISIFLDKSHLTVFWNELFSACYFAYYLMIPTFLTYLFLTRRDDSTKQFLTATCITFFVSYSLFFIYPIEGPRYYFAEQYVHQIEGPFFRQLVNLVIDNGAVRGGCMPSSHVAEALVVLVYVFRTDRKAGWLLLPVMIGLAIGTVWGRFHYIFDVVVGAAIGWGSIWIVTRFYDSWTNKTTVPVAKHELSTEHVS